MPPLHGTGNGLAKQQLFTMDEPHIKMKKYGIQVFVQAQYKHYWTILEKDGLVHAQIGRNIAKQKQALGPLRKSVNTLNTMNSEAKVKLADAYATVHLAYH
eukprot:1190101-Pyramimonas_sp.AAC.1